MKSDTEKTIEILFYITLVSGLVVLLISRLYGLGGF